MLCEFAHAFPGRLADILERDRHLKRNFREETATDLLMMGLLDLSSDDIKIDFPNETVTGGDMEWIYAAPQDVAGGTYLRLIIQAKRSKYAALKSGGYWFYDHLDHGVPAGTQAQTLVNYATSSPDGHATLPLYFFYHPRSAISPPITGRPDIEGLNVVLAEKSLPSSSAAAPSRKNASESGVTISSHSAICCAGHYLTRRPSPAHPHLGQRNSWLTVHSSERSRPRRRGIPILWPTASTRSWTTAGLKLPLRAGLNRRKAFLTRFGVRSLAKPPRRIGQS